MHLEAKKSLSQNFLINPQSRAKVVKHLGQNCALNNALEIVEIGPGTGLLTRDIQSLGLAITALEIDPRAVQILTNDPSFDSVKVICADATELITNPSQWTYHRLPTRDFVLFGNLPFNTGSRLIVDFCLNYPNIAMTVILQKEVISKLINTDHLTFFAAWILLFYKVQSHFTISAGNFDPKPKVDTALINLYPDQDEGLRPYLVTLQDRQSTLDILKALFQFPRKTIGNNLKNYTKDLTIYTKLGSTYPSILDSRLNRSNLVEIISLILSL
jgi:16S rRNA (adenine1518-N6/adenine1519-N6)-dimethyltransferase